MLLRRTDYEYVTPCYLCVYGVLVRSAAAVVIRMAEFLKQTSIAIIFCDTSTLYHSLVNYHAGMPTARTTRSRGPDETHYPPMITATRYDQAYYRVLQIPEYCEMENAR